MLRHPHIIAFKKAVLTPTHLAIVMEYAGGGELFQRIASAPCQRFGEAQARFFFRQLLEGIAYVHAQGMAHRDLKLENALLMDSTPRPRLCLCDFGYTKSEVLHSAFKTSNVGTPSYLAPELLTLSQSTDYDGQKVDVWAVGVILYVMLVGGYPFGDLGNGRELVRRIASANYTVPVPLTPLCTALLARIFVVDPAKRATVEELRCHPWCVVDPMPGPWPSAAGVANDGMRVLQSTEELMSLLRDAARVGDPAGTDEPTELYSEAQHAADCLTFD
jgi:serine/threonine-protein kinase SRK2